MSDDNLIKKNQIVDGQNILTDIEFQTIMDFINSGGGGNVDLSAYALRTNTVDKTTNQVVDGIKTFVKSPIVPDPANDNQAMNKGSLAPILATYPFLKGRGTFGTGAATTGGDLPATVENFAVYVNISTNTDGFYSPVADNIYDEGDFAIGMNNQWLRISGGEGVVKINGFKTREVNLKFSDLIDTEVMSLSHVGKVLTVVSVSVSDGAGGFIDVPRITFATAGSSGGAVLLDTLVLGPIDGNAAFMPVHAYDAYRYLECRIVGAMMHDDCRVAFGVGETNNVNLSGLKEISQGTSKTLALTSNSIIDTQYPGKYNQSVILRNPRHKADGVSYDGYGVDFEHKYASNAYTEALFQRLNNNSDNARNGWTRTSTFGSEGSVTGWPFFRCEPGDFNFVTFQLSTGDWWYGRMEIWGIK